jgi:pilus assembly protein Flp/PilA
MKSLYSLDSFRRFLRDEKAATAIEYAMIAAGIAVAIVATVMTVGTQVNALFERVRSGFPG